MCVGLYVNWSALPLPRAALADVGWEIHRWGVGGLKGPAHNPVSIPIFKV